MAERSGGRLDAATEATLADLLRRTFGFAELRPAQRPIIEAALAGRDLLAVMPTGGGKSLCYQLPALVLRQPTVVVSPLIALMRDQVSALKALGIGAASLNSAEDAATRREAVDGLADGSLLLLYTSPERLMMPGTLDLLRQGGVRRIAVDEAHCVSQWGHDFRPEYRGIGKVSEALGGIPVSAFTATADPATRGDIIAQLFQRTPEVFVHSFDRPNLFLAAAPKTNRTRQVLAFVAGRRGQSGIIYCSTRKRTEELAEALKGEGLTALPYHAGLPADVRARNQDRFLKEDGIIMVATVAFGMGIDKPDVRFVVEADLPKSIEAYYQEIGRAGRDGLPAETLMLYGLEDIRLRRQQIDDSDMPDEQKRLEQQRLNALVALCEAPLCRRQPLLAYFGERSERCGHCDLCRSGASTIDGTVPAQKALSAMRRTGERFGSEHIVAILLGEATEGITRHGHDKLPTFGVGKDLDRNAWRAVLRQLYALGLIQSDPEGHGGWFITAAGLEVLRGRERIEIREDTLAPRKSGRRLRAERVDEAGLTSDDEGLLADLKALRLSLARDENVPAYVIFADRTLIEMARQRPTSRKALAGIHGVGETKLRRFGDAFLDVIARG
jgi:ATP-dependent DNA helicase RecQ